MSIENKIKELRQSVEDLSAEEKVVKNRIQELRSLVAEKQKREESLDLLKKQEAELLKELGL